MINWKSYFNKIVCINFATFSKRKQLMQNQLKRVGILDSGIFEWQLTFSGPYEKLFLDMLNAEKNIYQLNNISCFLGHLKAIKKAYYEGCENILVIEDDERFLKNLDEIEKILQNKPNNEQCDVILFDRYITSNNEKNEQINQYYAKFNQNLLSTGCYALNKKAMKIIIDLTDQLDINTFDYYFNKQELKSQWIRICTLKPLAIQATFSDCKTFSKFLNLTTEQKIQNFQEIYKNQNINFDDYMMRGDGSSYNYGDIII